MGTLLNALVGALRLRTSVLTYSVIRDFFTCKIALVKKKKKKKSPAERKYTTGGDANPRLYWHKCVCVTVLGLPLGAPHFFKRKTVTRQEARLKTRDKIKLRNKPVKTNKGFYKLKPRN